MGRMFRTIKCRQAFVALIAIIATCYIFASTDARTKFKHLFRKRMEALTMADLQHMKEESIIIADNQLIPRGNTPVHIDTPVEDLPGDYVGESSPEEPVEPLEPAVEAHNSPEVVAEIEDLPHENGKHTVHSIKVEQSAKITHCKYSRLNLVTLLMFYTDDLVAFESF